MMMVLVVLVLVVSAMMLLRIATLGPPGPRCLKPNDPNRGTACGHTHETPPSLDPAMHNTLLPTGQVQAGAPIVADRSTIST